MGDCCSSYDDKLFICNICNNGYDDALSIFWVEKEGYICNNCFHNDINDSVMGDKSLFLQQQENKKKYEEGSLI